MKILTTVLASDIQFSQILVLGIFILLVILAAYQLVSFWKKDKNKSMYY
ncbi:MAG: hypothetical protein NWQ46_07635 [Spirosomaceae bacterium]|nr:hypothetical protein [Spirosomataceae bacterium]